MSHAAFYCGALCRRGSLYAAESTRIAVRSSITGASGWNWRIASSFGETTATTDERGGCLSASFVSVAMTEGASCGGRALLLCVGDGAVERRDDVTGEELEAVSRLGLASNGASVTCFLAFMYLGSRAINNELFS